MSHWFSKYPSEAKGAPGSKKNVRVAFFAKPSLRGLTNYIIRHKPKYGNITSLSHALSAWRIYKIGHTHTDKKDDTWTWVATHRDISGTMCRTWLFLEFEFFLNVSLMGDLLRAECGIGFARRSMAHLPFIFRPPTTSRSTFKAKSSSPGPKCLQKAIFHFLITSQAAFWMISEMRYLNPLTTNTKFSFYPS